MVMAILPRGHSQFISRAVPRSINGKEDPLWEDLEPSGPERDIPRGCRHHGERGLLFGGQLVELGKTGELFSSELLHRISLLFFFWCQIPVCICVRAK